MRSDLPDGKRLYCNDEDRETVHALAGENLAGRPVWVCRSCGNRRPGFFAAKPDVTLAADGSGGGSADGGGGE